MEIFAQILGLIGAGFNIGSYQLKKNSHLMLSQFLASTFFVFNYLLIGAFTGCCMNLIGTIRNFLFLYGQKFRKIPILIFLNLILIVATVLTWENAFSILPFIGMGSMTNVMYFNNGKTIRIAQLFISSPCWLIYNIINFTLGGILCEVFVIISTTISFIRFGFNGFEKD